MPNNSSHLDVISDAFGLSKLPEAIRNSLLEEIDALVFRSVLFRIMIDMDEDDKNELDDVLDKASDDFDKPFMFLKQKVKDFDQIVLEEVDKIKSENLSLTESFV
jgi:hypothetical protein